MNDEYLEEMEFQRDQEYEFEEQDRLEEITLEEGRQSNY